MAGKTSRKGTHRVARASSSDSRYLVSVCILPARWSRTWRGVARL